MVGRSYDHEVIAQSVIKPFGGVNMDAPGDAAVIAPIQGGTQGAVISNGIVPRYSDIDAYAMAAFQWTGSEERRLRWCGSGSHCRAR